MFKVDDVCTKSAADFIRSYIVIIIVLIARIKGMQEHLRYKECHMVVFKVLAIAQELPSSSIAFLYKQNKSSPTILWQCTICMMI